MKNCEVFCYILNFGLLDEICQEKILDTFFFIGYDIQGDENG